MMITKNKIKITTRMITVVNNHIVAIHIVRKVVKIKNRMLKKINIQSYYNMCFNLFNKNLKLINNI